jgi:hypothetical protein
MLDRRDDGFGDLAAEIAIYPHVVRLAAAQRPETRPGTLP